MIYKERHRERVKCPECRKDLTRGSLAAYCQTQHGVEKGGTENEGNGDGRGDDTRNERMAFPEKAGPRPCPVEECSGRTATRTTMQMHF